MASRLFEELGFIISQDEIDTTLEFLDKYIDYLKKYQPQAVETIKLLDEAKGSLPTFIDELNSGEELI